ncbi:MAG: radical SAM protein [Aigarchaeota archaeon]|nr:radical SAM protein [Aigarchaeota archaeon]MCX8192791.1 radical SAM protein [Nitrososphaeria archaeon]
MNRFVLPPYIPPSLIMRQAMTLTTFKEITGWRGLGYWLRYIKTLLNVAAGAIGLGCFGYPVHPVYEVTSNCNLRCVHCHARGGEKGDRELRTEEAKKIIENLAHVDDFRMLVFTGGEPLIRNDLLDLVRYARNMGFSIVIATNGVLITRDVVRKMVENGVEGVAVSIDFTSPDQHDDYRGVRGALRSAIKGIINARREKMYTQINITLSRRNLNQLKQLLEISDKLEAHVTLLYQLMPSGRGEQLINEALSISEFYYVIKTLENIQSTVKPIIIPVGLPEFFAYLALKKNLNPRLASLIFKGCIAGRGMFYIKPNGDVWPCPFLPINTGNLLEKNAEEIWRGEVFNIFRDRRNLKGFCRECNLREVCGGCRARSYAYSGDPLSSDPSCFLNRNLSRDKYL